MPQYALFRDDVFDEARTRATQPEDLPHRNIKWYPVGTSIEGTPAGWSVVDGEAIQTVEPAPAPSTDPNDYPLNKVQFHAMVGIMGKKAAIEAAIAAISDATQRSVAEAKYLHSDRFDRDDALFDALAPAVWPDETVVERTAIIDTAWMQAKDIV